VTIEPVDDAAATDTELGELVEGLVPIVTEYISNKWDWRPWMTQPPTIGAGDGVPVARPPGWIADDAWTVVFEGAYPWAIGFVGETHEPGAVREYVETHRLFVDCQAGYAISVRRDDEGA